MLACNAVENDLAKALALGQSVGVARRVVESSIETGAHRFCHSLIEGVGGIHNGVLSQVQPGTLNQDNLLVGALSQTKERKPTGSTNARRHRRLLGSHPSMTIRANHLVRLRSIIRHRRRTCYRYFPNSLHRPAPPRRHPAASHSHSSRRTGARRGQRSWLSGDSVR
jgi:hypothetical protein